ncbi:MAG: hypothetical protein PF630_00820 [Gammaproteobacteria bacterium]|jgi:hypothetical protein|nr:hypothetical protein [Gammaproteobacteria bacterium]
MLLSNLFIDVDAAESADSGLQLLPANPNFTAPDARSEYATGVDIHRDDAHFEAVDVTDSVEASLCNVSMVHGIFQFDLVLFNTSGSDFAAQIEFNIMNIYSASGRVEVAHADNAGGGNGVDDLAVFRFPRQADTRFVLGPGQATEDRRLQFCNRQEELFMFDALVTASRLIVADDNGMTRTNVAQLQSLDPTANDTDLLRFTINPLTLNVTVEMLCMKGIRGYVCEKKRPQAPLTAVCALTEELPPCGLSGSPDSYPAS